MQHQLGAREESDAIRFYLAGLPSFNRSLGARTEQGLHPKGLLLKTDEVDVFINPRESSPVDSELLPETTYRHSALLRRRDRSPLSPTDADTLLQQVDLFLHFLGGRPTYPAGIALWRTGKLVQSVVGPLGIKGAGVRNGRGLSIGNEYERHELCFVQFVKLTSSPEARRHFGEALRWRDTAARGIAAVRIASAFTALDRLGLMHAANVISSPTASRIKISGRKYKLLGLRDRANYVVGLLGHLDNAWLSSAYQPLSSLGRRADWKPGEVVAHLRNFALHAERHVEFGTYSRMLADLAAHYAVDVFNSVILRAIGYRGPLAPSAAPFDLRAWINLTDN